MTELYVDSLYGSIKGLEDYEELLKLEPLKRIDGISLAAVMPEFKLKPPIDSRLKHSIGVFHLSSFVTWQEPLKELKQLIELSSLLHDVGHPPFSHLSDPYLEEVLGKRHELFAEEFIAKTEVADFINARSFRPEEVTGFINGRRKPFSDLISGSIDLDNLDNTQRYGLQLGILKKMFYNSERISSSFYFNGNSFQIKSKAKSQILQWEKVRELVYDEVYSDANLYFGSLLRKSLDLLLEADALEKDFFYLNDKQALGFLSQNELTRETISFQKNGLKKRFFELSFDNEIHLRQRLETDRKIASLLGIKESLISIETILDNRNKQIHIPFDDNSYHASQNRIQTKKIIFYCQKGLSNAQKQKLKKIKSLSDLL